MTAHKVSAHGLLVIQNLQARFMELLPAVETQARSYLCPSGKAA
jgi:hypothetical protein